MKRIFFGIVAASLVTGAFGGTTSGMAPAESAARGALTASRTQNAETSSEGRAVADWSLIAQNAIVAVGRRFPGEAAVFMGIVHAAIYDVVVAIEGGYRPYAITPTVPPNTSLEAAVATFAASKEIGLGKIAGPLRAALAGRTVTPSVFDMMLVIGRDESLARIRDAVA